MVFLVRVMLMLGARPLLERMFPRPQAQVHEVEFAFERPEVHEFPA